ncbi:MAG: TetR/AcrR family transcriptional regulator [Leptospiraceae bacterium]|nr:TetR/AcrR family transcriptional regulator [Leptospiraceae bacterium]
MGRKGYSKEKIFTGAIQLFNLRGVLETGVSEIAEVVGIPKGSFYNHFKSKDEFIREAILFHTESVLEYNKKFLVHSKLPIRQRILSLYKDKIKLAKHQMLLNENCLINWTSLEMGGKSVLINQTLHECYKKIKNQILETMNLSETPLTKLNLSNDDLVEFLESSWRGTLLSMKGQCSSKPILSFQKFLIELFQ